MTTTITTDTVTVTIEGIGEFEGKIDTGAGQTSLHADWFVIEDAYVSFSLNDRVYRCDLADQQDIASADGGTTTRPCIQAAITIADKTVECVINLNNREEMPEQLLIGVDVIKAAELTLEFNAENSVDQEAMDQDASPGMKPENEELLPAEPETPDQLDEPEQESELDTIVNLLQDIKNLLTSVLGDKQTTNDQQ